MFVSVPCRRKEKSRLWAAAQVPYSLMARLRRHPPLRAGLMQASALFRSGQPRVPAGAWQGDCEAAARPGRTPEGHDRAA